MKTIDFNKFILAQLHAIEKSIYIESEKSHTNLRYINGKLNEDFFINWIDIHAKEFYEAWDKSLCKDCKNVTTCYDCLKDKCYNFE